MLENSAQPYDWGRDDGCGHFEICPTGKEYCQSSQDGANVCSPDHSNKAYCTFLEGFMEGCGIIRNRGTVACMKKVSETEVAPDPEEVFGVHSRCFQWRTISNKVLISQCHLAKVIK